MYHTPQHVYKEIGLINNIVSIYIQIQSVCQSLHLSTHPSIHPSVHPSHPFIHPFSFFPEHTYRFLWIQESSHTNSLIFPKLLLVTKHNLAPPSNDLSEDPLQNLDNEYIIICSFVHHYFHLCME